MYGNSLRSLMIVAMIMSWTPAEYAFVMTSMLSKSRLMSASMSTSVSRAALYGL